MLNAGLASVFGIAHTRAEIHKKMQLLRRALGLRTHYAVPPWEISLSKEEWNEVVAYVETGVDQPRRQQLLEMLGYAYTTTTEERVNKWKGVYHVVHDEIGGRSKWRVSWTHGAPFEVERRLRMANAVLGKATRLLVALNGAKRIDKFRGKFVDGEIVCEETECCICNEDMREMEVLLTRCGHSFHASCLERWLQTRSPRSCPMCRRLVISDDK